MLHITNGESAAAGIRAAGVPGRVVAWNDVLHDGPVPAGLDLDQLSAVRAQFIAGNGWRTADDALREFAERDAALRAAPAATEVVLWFEHDLYDQLQLIQLLDWFAERPPRALALICNAEYLGELEPPKLFERFQARRPVTPGQLSLAKRAWAAFRAPDPAAIERLLADDLDALRFLGAALTRHLEQFPSIGNGLSRTESQILDALADGPAAPRAVYYNAHHTREHALFLGDSSFALYVVALSQCDVPLIRAADGDRVSPGDPAFWSTPVRLTEFGRSVAVNERDHVRTNGIDRWLGGVHLRGAEAAWRWDTAERRLVRGPE